MINFTVGPVESYDYTLNIARESSPYFRTNNFSNMMLNMEKQFLQCLQAPKGSRAVFLTTSGTGAMEACVMNVLNENDNILVINGGTFGARFVELCSLHKLKFEEIKCNFGEQITAKKLADYSNKGFTALLVNMHETSSGVLYDMKAISDFCKENGIVLIVDAISAFIADEINMKELNASVIITGSQKALAVHPGVALIALSQEALDRVDKNEEKCMYLSLKEALKNMERGQTPFTPAVSVLLQLATRFGNICNDGGIEVERQKVRELTEYFRSKIVQYEFEFVVENSKDRSNAVTALRTPKKNARFLFETLERDYHIWLCPNGGIYKDEIFRIGHIGNLTKSDYDNLFEAFDKLNLRKK